MVTEMLTAEELAKILKVAPWTVCDWAREGVIPEVRISYKTRRFILEDVLAVLRKRRGLVPGKRTVATIK